MAEHWRKTAEIGGKPVRIELGEIARQAAGAALVRCGQAALLATVVAGDSPSDAGFMPLTVNYQVRLAGAGRIPGGFLRREARPTDAETLASRVIDRSIRPLFPDSWRCETQIQALLLSADAEVDAESLAILGVSAALEASNLPFDGPVAGLRVARVDGEWLLMPGHEACERSDLNFIASFKGEGIVMAEGSAEEVSEAEALAGLEAIREGLAPVWPLLAELRERAGERRSVAEAPVNEALAQAIESAGAAGLREALQVPEKLARAAARREARTAALADFADEPEAKALYGALEKRLIRESVAAGRRLDGRGWEDIRPITGATRWLDRPHGSALFQRGETQAMVTATLGSDRDAQLIEGPEGVRHERFLLHYSFPPFSVGEARPVRGPGRREIGHGKLAWSAIRPVLPLGDDFAYTIRLDSIITESNGSSSMATVCGGALALMDAGVPIRRPVAGIAMGLVKEGESLCILSDILGDEDHVGDMDFKVAGTAEGITAIQLDNKLGSLPSEVMERGFEQARRGRLHILGEMAKILEGPRPDYAPGVPRAYSRQVPTNRRRSLIGPGGKNIKRIEAESESQVSLGDDGVCRIFAPDEQALQVAIAILDDLTGLPTVGETIHGKVTGVKHFGVFVRLFEGIEGMIQAEQLEGRNVQMGSTVAVKVEGVDDRGRISLSLAV